MQKELLRLFNGVLVSEYADSTHMYKNILVRTIRNGYIVDPRADVSTGMLDVIESIVGISGEKANASFHKSWDVVANSSMELLVLEQIIHYITTYGFEALGIYSEDTVYIPNEVLNLPNISDRIPLTVIKAMTVSDVFENVKKLTHTGIALSQETLNDLKVIVDGLGKKCANIEFVEGVKNREFKAYLYELYGLVPTQPEEYVRYVINKLTGETLVIKNSKLIAMIKLADGALLDKLLVDAPVTLATVFFRYKPLLLAMKSITRNKNFFNRLRKDAESMHQPMGEDYMNSITSQLKNGTFDYEKFKLKLKDATIFRKIRLAYALQYRLDPADHIVYQVRNGKGFVKEFSKTVHRFSTALALGAVSESIAEDIKAKIGGQTVYIPENVHYALPATEKQFIGFLPNGTYVTVPDDLIVGIHWENYDGHRVDLDFSMTSINGKYGWDGSYRSDDSRTLFSGDITDAPASRGGASEMFYMKKSRENEALLLNVNDFRSNAEGLVYKFFVASEEVSTDFRKDYMVDVSNIVAQASVTVKENHSTLGLVARVNDEQRVYFSASSFDSGRSVRVNDKTINTQEFFLKKALNPIEFNDILVMAGANVVTEKPVEGEFIDLSIEALDKTSIIGLLL